MVDTHIIPQLGYNDLTIDAQRDIAPVLRGNVGGRYEKIKWHHVSNEPVKKNRYAMRTCICAKDCMVEAQVCTTCGMTTWGKDWKGELHSRLINKR